MIPSNSYASNEETTIDSAENKWIIEQMLDDFGDLTGDGIMRITTEGIFSNTATTDSKLAVGMYYDDAEDEFRLRLVEYNSTRALYTESSEIELKMKVDDTIYDHYLWAGTAPNGDILIADKYQQLANSIRNDNILSTEDLSFEESAYQELTQFWSDGKNIRFVVYIDNSKYSFEISSEEFLDCFY